MASASGAIGSTSSEAASGSDAMIALATGTPRRVLRLWRVRMISSAVATPLPDSKGADIAECLTAEGAPRATEAPTVARGADWVRSRRKVRRAPPGRGRFHGVTGRATRTVAAFTAEDVSGSARFLGTANLPTGSYGVVLWASDVEWSESSSYTSSDEGGPCGGQGAASGTNRIGEIQFFGPDDRFYTVRIVFDGLLDPMVAPVSYPLSSSCDWVVEPQVGGDGTVAFDDRTGYEGGPLDRPLPDGNRTKTLEGSAEIHELRYGYEAVDITYVAPDAPARRRL